MIEKLTIKNFAIIDDMTVKFHNGFNIITGETGAGKSLIINAIDLLFGSKVNQQMVRLAGEPISIGATFKSNGENVVLTEPKFITLPK